MRFINEQNTFRYDEEGLCNMSRPKKEINQKRFLELYNLYKSGKITKAKMAEELDISKVTLSKRLNDYIDATKEDVTEEVIVEDNSNVQIFNNKEFGSVRVITINDEPWFVGKDVAELLGYSNPRKTLGDHVDDEDKKIINHRVTKRDGIKKRGNPNIALINESGIYSLILSSKLPSAKKFKRWITTEVLPSIRKNGAYMTPETLQQALYNPDFLIQLATNLKTEQEKNMKLQKENDNLLMINSVLTKEINEWDNRSLITHLIRKYGCCVYDNKFGLAWREFYRNLQYKLHINLNKRLSSQDKTKKNTLDMVKENEWDSILQIAVAMCEGAGINTVDIIEKHGIIS